MTWKDVFKFFGMKWLYYNVFYLLDSSVPNPKSVKGWLIDNRIKLIKEYESLYVAGKVPKFTGTNDDKMLKILRWVIQRMRYTRDKDLFGKVEYWNNITTDENDGIIDMMLGDCEDGSLLIYCLARAHKISPAQLRFVACEVSIKDKDGKEVDNFYHARVDYMADYSMPKDGSEGVWYSMDWCVYPDLTKFEFRIPVDRSVYVKDIFQVTDFEI